MASKPYDVLSTDEARAEAAENPLSFLHVGKPEIDLPPGTDPHHDRVYEKARENLDGLISTGILRQDDHSSFYIYGMTMGQHRQFGIAGCVSVAEYLDSTIRKHELTRPDKETDRMRHILSTRAHTGPVFLLYRADPGIDAIVNRCTHQRPEYDFYADEVRHQLWVVKDGRTIDLLADALRRVSTLYIADGHHRSAAAARAFAEQRSRGFAPEGAALFLAVLVPHNQAQILEYNRVVKDLNGLGQGAFVTRVQERFTVRTSAQPVRPAGKGRFGMYLNGQWYTLNARPELLADPDPVSQLDVSILQEHLFAPLLGIEDPRTNTRVDFVGGIRGWEELERRVNAGRMAAAFSLFPTSVEELLTIADAGRVMPPKSTWFEPKLRDGVVVHVFE